jgi:hypothetical protein
MHDWMSTVLHEVVAEVTGQISAKQIEGLAKLLFNYIASESEGDFGALYSYTQTLEPFFTKPLKPENNLTYLTMYGTVALAIYRAAYFSYDDIYRAKPSAADKAQKLTNLTDGIKALRDAVASAFAAARQGRLALVVVGHHKTGLVSGEFVPTDRYTGLNGPTYKYSVLSVKDLTEAAAAKHAEFMKENAAAPTFDAEFDVYLEVADLWSYFAQPADGGKLTTAPKTVSMGMWARPTLPIWHGLVPRPAPFSVNAGPGQALTRVVLHGGKDNRYVDGLEFEIDGKSAGTFGATSKTPLDLKIAANQSIIGVFGASGAKLDRVSLRIETHDAAGDAIAFPEESGLGAKDGGVTFSAAGPEGGRGAVTGFFGQTDGGLNALGCYWTRDRVQPLA